LIQLSFITTLLSPSHNSSRVASHSQNDFLAFLSPSAAIIGIPRCVSVAHRHNDKQMGGDVVNLRIIARAERRRASIASMERPIKKLQQGGEVLATDEFGDVTSWKKVEETSRGPSAFHSFRDSDRINVIDIYFVLIAESDGHVTTRSVR